MLACCYRLRYRSTILLSLITISGCNQLRRSRTYVAAIPLLQKADHGQKDTRLDLLCTSKPTFFALPSLKEGFMHVNWLAHPTGYRLG